MNEKQIKKLKALVEELRKMRPDHKKDMAGQLIQYLAGVLDGIPDKK